MCMSFVDVRFMAAYEVKKGTCVVGEVQSGWGCVCIALWLPWGMAVEVSMCSGDVQPLVDARFVTGWSSL